MAPRGSRTLAALSFCGPCSCFCLDARLDAYVRLPRCIELDRWTLDVSVMCAWTISVWLATNSIRLAPALGLGGFVGSARSLDDRRRRAGVALFMNRSASVPATTWASLIRTRRCGPRQRFAFFTQADFTMDGCRKLLADSQQATWRSTAFAFEHSFVERLSLKSCVVMYGAERSCSL